MNKHIKLWVRPSNPIAPPPGVEYTSAREFYAYDRFASALSEAIGRTVEVIERPPEEASGSGIVLLHLDLELANALAMHAERGIAEPERRFLLNGAREDAVRAVERGSALGAVLGDRYFQWRHDQERRARSDVFGRKSLAPALAPRLTPTGPIETESCADYESDPHLSLPAAVALYLSVCAHEGSQGH